MKRVRGFSLLETLAALALLALLLLGVYSGVRTTTISATRGASAIERLDEVRGAREFLRRELASATALPWKLSAGDAPVVFEGSASALQFVAPLPGYLGLSGAQVVSVRLADDETERSSQRLVVRFAPLPTGSGALPSMAPEVLLEKLHGVRFSYADSSGTWHDEWADTRILPTLVRVEVNAQDGAPAREWPTLMVAPRQGQGAVNPGAVGRSLRADVTP